MKKTSTEPLIPSSGFSLLIWHAPWCTSCQALLAAFHPASSADAGLDAVQVMPDGALLVSDVAMAAAWWLVVAAVAALRGGRAHLPGRGHAYAHR